ncbi:hypothetical protein [Sphingomonas sp.]|jgi:hypothetical protein|uniref:hypothetical protein n=1 Tax=Sphingomonas sp. TaxID=28214 RepID=UPI002DE483DE|nr:hypothetical protein [Sphingomonas sp.]
MLTTIGLAAAALLAGEEILDRAADAAGGDEWLNARTLVLSGTAVFYGPAGSEPRSRATDYRMWRVFDPARSAAHGAEGKVRILACDGKRQLFTVGYDGKTTWTERGVTPKAEADAFWASNFGFGIIRHARKPGFKAERVPDDIVGNHRLYMVRLTDPAGGTTLFGVDKQSFAIRLMGFASPRGWHVRTYDDFYRLPNARWLQARKVTLYYNGVKANEVMWQQASVNFPIDDALFAPSSKLACGDDR